jgi:hypothetical protein
MQFNNGSGFVFGTVPDPMPETVPDPVLETVPDADLVPDMYPDTDTNPD